MAVSRKSTTLRTPPITRIETAALRIERASDGGLVVTRTIASHGAVIKLSPDEAAMLRYFANNTSPPPTEGLAERVIHRLRSSVNGLTAHDLSELTRVPREEMRAVLDRLHADQLITSHENRARNGKTMVRWTLVEGAHG